MPETIGRCYELCGNDRLTYLELLDAVAAAMGRTAPFKLPVPLFVMKRVVPIMQRLPQFPITMDQMQMLIEENICDGRWQEVFGFTPREFQEGIRAYLGRLNNRHT